MDSESPARIRLLPCLTPTAGSSVLIGRGRSLDGRAVGASPRRTCRRSFPESTITKTTDQQSGQAMTGVDVMSLGGAQMDRFGSVLVRRGRSRLDICCRTLRPIALVIAVG